jgi:hypothetical protein
MFIVWGGGIDRALGGGRRFIIFGGMEGGGLIYSAADVAWVMVCGVWVGFVWQEIEWGGACRDIYQVPCAYGGDTWLNIGCGLCIFFFFGTQRRGYILLQTSHGWWCRGLGGVCLVGNRLGGDL